jgi:hypothetical protein
VPTASGCPSTECSELSRVGLEFCS